MMRSHDDPATERLARDTGFSVDAIDSLRGSIARGGGRMAQFDHAEFGGAGQWMQGGGTMISDFGNDDLKRRVAALCDALAVPEVGHGAAWQEAATARDVPTPPASPAAGDAWYPAAFGSPDVSGSQDGMRYAWFAGPRRLAVDDGRRVTIRDTGDHRIGGVSQQQGAATSLRFTSQHGPLDLERLPVVEGPAAGPRASGAVPSKAEAAMDPFVALEKLAELHARGIVDAAEFASKKAELLDRI